LERSVLVRYEPPSERRITLINIEKFKETLKELIAQVAALDIDYHLLVELNPRPSHKHYRMFQSPSIILHRLRLALYSHVVLGLSKLFYQQDRDITLHELLEQVTKNYAGLALDENILSEADVRALQTEVASHDFTIQRLKVQRNKQVAHNDKQLFGKREQIAELTLYFSEMKTLLDLAIKVVFSINKAYGDDFQFRGREQAHHDTEEFFKRILHYDEYLREEEQREIEELRRRMSSS
jgi:hypothetical protein